MCRCGVAVAVSEVRAVSGARKVDGVRMVDGGGVEARVKTKQAISLAMSI
jgi:hypothetical protein